MTVNNVAPGPSATLRLLPVPAPFGHRSSRFLISPQISDTPWLINQNTLSLQPNKCGALEMDLWTCDVLTPSDTESVCTRLYIKVMNNQTLLVSDQFWNIFRLFRPLIIFWFPILIFQIPVKLTCIINYWEKVAYLALCLQASES